MSTLNISPTFVPTPDPVDVPHNGKLTVVVPTGGCTICLQTAIGGEYHFNLSEDRTFELKGHSANSIIKYDVQAYNSACPTRAKRNAHSIQIGSGK